MKTGGDSSPSTINVSNQMLNDVDFTEEALSFAIEANYDEAFNFELSNVLEDINFDNLNFPDAIFSENVIDTSDSDSGISNHGEKHPFLCDIEQGSLDVPKSESSSEIALFPPTASVPRNLTDSDPTLNASYALPHLKRPRPQEPLITSYDHASVRQSSIPCSITRTLSLGSTPLKLDTRHHTGQVINHHLPSKLPRILSRGQNSGSQIVVTGSNQAIPQQLPFYYTNNKSELSISSPATTPASSVSNLSQQKPHLMPAVVSLPVLDEFTFSNSFQIIAPPTETESIEKLVKKQERMIKNRQAACLSRLRKKEYLERLESKLDELKQENAYLRQENNEWRNRYGILEKSLDNLQAEYASLCQASQSGGSEGNEDTSSPSSPSTSSLNYSPPLLSSAVSTTSSTPRFTPVSLPSIKQTLAPPLQQSLFFSNSSSSHYSSGVTGKISLLRKPQQTTDRIVLQKPFTGDATASRVLGKGAHFLPIVGGGGSTIALPRGVRKKVTTSLFILACLFIVNLSVTPFGQLSSPFSVSFDSARNIVARSSDYDPLMLKPAIASRTLLSVPVVSKSVSEATESDQQMGKNITKVTMVSDKPLVNTTDTAVAEITRCHPNEIYDLMNQQMWLVLDGDDEDDAELPLLERQKQTAHSRHVNSNNQTISSPEHRHLLHTNLLSRFPHRKTKRAFLVRPPVNETGESEWNLTKRDLVDTLYPDSDSPLLPNLTIFLHNFSSKSAGILPGGANLTERSIRLCKLQVQVSSLKDLRRRWKG